MSESTKEYIVPTYVMKVGYNDLEKIKEFAWLNNPDGALWICTTEWGWEREKIQLQIKLFLWTLILKYNLK